MLTFEPYSLASLQRILPYLKKSDPTINDLTAGSLFLWEVDTDLSFCVRNDTLVVCQKVGEQPAFSYPIGKDPTGMIDELLCYIKEKNLPLRFFAVDERTLEKIQKDDRLKSPMWSYDERWSDYIYSFDEAKTFAGRKYSGQRNHVNKFRKLYGEPDIRRLTPADLPAVAKMLAEYETEHPDAGLLERIELSQTKNLLAVYETLGLYAVGLFVKDELAAFAIGEVVGKTLFIHVEKALRRFEGAYPTIYSGFVRLVDSLADQPLCLVDREDDSGDMGLRISKMQYHPIEKRNKYLVHVDSPAAKIPKDILLAAGDVFLTSFRETDKQVYYILNTDIENNRYWGYDYREDASLTGSIDENTFYDSAVFDMQVGDSINFAIRLAPAGEMIGEAILWNFTFNGTCELGCRILPAYQGRGYGKAAFSAAATFAEQTLGLSVIARCDKQNTASRHMIEDAGFSLTRQDESYFYFDRKTKT
ncbi:MAG: GNAT family N-acetyltransferase [Clostridia bacterium]|nr:GNAT family N-acetyltransferase [Clostridia bacterium]